VSAIEPQQNVEIHVLYDIVEFFCVKYWSLFIRSKKDVIEGVLDKTEHNKRAVSKKKV